jgi:hypothetical protein
MPAEKVRQERRRIWGYFNSASRQAGNPQHRDNEFCKGSPVLWVLFVPPCGTDKVVEQITRQKFNDDE